MASVRYDSMGTFLQRCSSQQHSIWSARQSSGQRCLCLSRTDPVRLLLCRGG